MELVGSIAPAALAARDQFADYAGGETILAISAPDDSAAGHSCGERCVILNRAMENLAAGLKQHAPQLVNGKRLLLAVMDGKHCVYFEFAVDQVCHAKSSKNPKRFCCGR